MNDYDARALRVARVVQERAQPEFAILFGSRARGDHDELTSDIDVMLVLAAEPGADAQRAADREAQQAAEAAYGREVPVQLTWRTVADFRHSRRYTNSVETNAMREGIVMPRNPESYQAGDYEDEETEYEYNWGDYENRLFHAETHLDEFEYMAVGNRSDLAIGQHAQRALEHGLKALIAAHGADYPKIHNIGALIGAVREHDPGMRNFRLGIPADVYSEYAGEDAYQEQRIRPKLTEHADYLAKTRAAAQFIIERAKTIYAQSQQGG